MKTYVDYCKDFIKDNLGSYEGESVYTCDLYSLITESINVNGSCTYSTYKAKKYIKEWFYECGEYTEYCERMYGEFNINPFVEPELFMVGMVIEGVDKVLSKCEYIEENWDKKIELTEIVIEEILNQVNCVEEIEF